MITRIQRLIIMQSLAFHGRCSVVQGLSLKVKIPTTATTTTTTRRRRSCNYEAPVPGFAGRLSLAQSDCSARQSPSPAAPLSPVDDSSVLEWADTSTACNATWLVVGDGDLSYSASLAEQLLVDQTEMAEENRGQIRLIATVLEDETTHNTVYRDSKRHTQSILRSDEKHAVLFNVDATQLERHFPLHTLDRIVFNFPHWRGKSNHRRNRQLLDDFFRSAANVLKVVDAASSSSSSSSEIHVALLHGQGGADAATMHQWRNSWMAQVYAAEHGLVLRRLEPFDATSRYNLSSHRGADRPFAVGALLPLTYVFGRPRKETITSSSDPRSQTTTTTIDPKLHMAFRHELRIRLDPEKLATCGFRRDDIVQGDVVPNLVREFTPAGIRCDVPMRDLITASSSASSSSLSTMPPMTPLLIFLVVYASSEQRCLTRSAADRIRKALDAAVVQRLGLEVPKCDRMVSKPFPYHLLSALMEERSNDDE